jgi:cytochrome b561
MISYSTQVRIKRSLRVGGTLPVAWSTGTAALIAGCAEFHVAFGMLLCAFVALRFMNRLQDSDLAEDACAREFARHLSRLIYLMLYSVLFLKFLVELTSFSWIDGPALRWSAHFQAAPERVFVECGERFRADLLWGVIALCLVRVLAAHQLRAETSRATGMWLRMSTLLRRPRPGVQN